MYAAVLGEHEKTTDDERMRVGGRRRHSDDDLREVRHARAREEGRTRLRPLDHAFTVCAAHYAHNIAGKQCIPPAHTLAAQLTEHLSTIHRDVDNTVVDLQNPSVLMHSRLPTPSFPSGCVVPQGLYRPSSVRCFSRCSSSQRPCRLKRSGARLCRPLSRPPPQATDG